MDKNYKHATDMEERLRRASDAAIVGKGQSPSGQTPLQTWYHPGASLRAQPPNFCYKCGTPFSERSVAHAFPVDGEGIALETFWACAECASLLDRRHGRDPVEDFNPTRWAVLSAVIILVIITLNVM